MAIPRRIRWAGHVARVKESVNTYPTVFMWKPDREEREQLKGVSVDVLMIFRWILKKLNGRLWTEFIWLRIAPSAGLFCTRLRTFSCDKFPGICIKYIRIPKNVIWFYGYNFIA
jgi:hypothetical protein